MLLGESGAGKSVVLETIAGLITPDSGSIILDDQDISRMPIQERKVGLVFQDYAVFPHLNVHQNIAYPLKGKCSSREKELRIKRIARKTGIEHLLHRQPPTLSGGELQRVAIARTLITEPKLLLLDEPLASLDPKLRSGLRKLLKELHHEGQTIIHVTHDLRETLHLADKIAVMHQGRIVQTAPPLEILQHPEHEFVAHFIGEQNYFPAKVIREANQTVPLLNNGIRVFLENPGSKETTPIHEHPVSLDGNPNEHQQSEYKGFILIRNQEIIVSREPFDSSARNQLQGKITEIILTEQGYTVVTDAGLPIHANITRESMERFGFQIGDPVWLTFKASGVQFIQADR